MRIAVVAPGYRPDIGGVETVVTEVAEHVAAAGHEIEVWTQGRAVRQPQCSDARGVLVRRFPAYGLAHYPVSPALWRHLRRHATRFDIVHAHSYHSAAALGLVAASFESPLVYTPHFHGGGHTRPARALHRGYGRVARRLLDRADAIVAVSHAELDLVRRGLPVDARRTTVVPNGVDALPIAVAAPLALQQPTVLVLGRLERYKRVDAVLAGFFAAGVDGARLVVVGDGPDRRRLEERAGNRPDVEFLGHVDDVSRRRWLRTAHVVVSLSSREAFGLVALEAAAAGAHVVLSDIPAHREVAEMLPSTLPRLVTDPTDPAAVAEVIAAGLLRQRPKPCAVRTWADVARDHLALYGGLLAGRRDLANMLLTT